MSHILKHLLRRLAGPLLVFGLLAMSGIASAGWEGVCLNQDPAVTTSPYSVDYGVEAAISPLFGVTAGVSGTVMLGHFDMTKPQYTTCWKDATFNAAGGWSMGIPEAGGTIYSGGLDAGMALTMGWADDPVLPWSFFRITSDGTPANSVIFGSGGYSIAFTGTSQRYFVLGSPLTVGGLNIFAQCTCRVIGDGAQLTWAFQNTDVSAANVGILAGVSPAMRLDQPDAATGRQTANIIPIFQMNGTVFPPFGGNFYAGFSQGSGTRPLRVETKYTNDVQGFPSDFEFRFGQSTGYGLRVDLVPDTTIFQNADASDMLIVANRYQILRDDEAMNLSLFGDFTGTETSNDILLAGSGVPSFGAMVSFIQRIPVKVVPPGQTVNDVMYFHLAHTQGLYFDPYTLVMDMPETVSWGDPANNGGYPTSIKIGAWLDNQYSVIEKEVTLNNVRMTLTLPPNAGLKLDPSDSRVKNVGTIAPNAMVNGSWNLVVDPTHPGDVVVTIQVDAVPGPTKILTKIIRVAASSEYVVNPGANLYTFPYQVNDSSLASSFQSPNIDPATGQPVQLLPGRDFVAYTWDPQLRTYVPAQSVQRGVGMWFVPTTAIPTFTVKGATVPADQDQGGLLVGLRPGWNLIGNPYNYPIQLAEMVGVDESTPQQSLTWDQLVAQDSVSGALNTWDAVNGQYTSIAGNSAVMEPNEGYWIFVTSASPVRLIYPPLFRVQVPNISSRAVTSPTTTWQQTDRQWRLQLAASSTFGMDSNNYVGVTRNNKILKTLNVLKPPAAPNSKLELNINDAANKTTESRMAQSIAAYTGKKDWTVNVKSLVAGDVNLTWPNLASVPRNAKLILKDNVTGESKDLHTASGITVNFAKPGTRSFTLSLSTSGSVRPVITNALAVRSSRESNAPVEISYTLSDSALVTVRVLSSTGKEVYTATRGRADNAGNNTVVWALHDNANRAVAPGTYQVEILAETPSGDRVRRIVPVNVIR